ncbi:hypothetical protein BZA77DRAFT_290823 [Pyronema omphalodes]|nr:hypothetical protein BZA77DRAFT_290823 [Pyronema omphalodes]
MSDHQTAQASSTAHLFTCQDGTVVCLDWATQVVQWINTNDAEYQYRHHLYNDVFPISGEELRNTRRKVLTTQDLCTSTDKLVPIALLDQIERARLIFQHYGPQTFMDDHCRKLMLDCSQNLRQIIEWQNQGVAYDQLGKLIDSGDAPITYCINELQILIDGSLRDTDRPKNDGSLPRDESEYPRKTQSKAENVMEFIFRAPLSDFRCVMAVITLLEQKEYISLLIKAHPNSLLADPVPRTFLEHYYSDLQKLKYGHPFDLYIAILEGAIHTCRNWQESRLENASLVELNDLILDNFEVMLDQVDKHVRNRPKFLHFDASLHQEIRRRKNMNELGESWDLKGGIWATAQLTTWAWTVYQTKPWLYTIEIQCRRLPHVFVGCCPSVMSPLPAGVIFVKTPRHAKDETLSEYQKLGQSSID